MTTAVGSVGPRDGRARVLTDAGDGRNRCAGYARSTAVPRDPPEGPVIWIDMDGWALGVRH